MYLTGQVALPRTRSFEQRQGARAPYQLGATGFRMLLAPYALWRASSHFAFPYVHRDNSFQENRARLEAAACCRCVSRFGGLTTLHSHRLRTSWVYVSPSFRTP